MMKSEICVRKIVFHCFVLRVQGACESDKLAVCFEVRLLSFSLFYSKQHFTFIARPCYNHVS